MKKKKNSILRQIAKYILRGIGIIILIFLTWSMIPIRQTIRPIQKRAETKYWTMRDGSKIAYSLLKGDSANINPPIIYLHGGPGGYVHSAIIKQMDEVAKKGYDVYLYDQIGSGLSDRLSRPKDYSFERHLNDLKEIINSHIMSDKVILLGHSFGGILAVHFCCPFSE